MSEQTERLKIALGEDNDALIRVLKSRLYDVFGQFMTVDDIIVETTEDGISVKAIGGELKRVGHCCFDNFGR